MSTETATYQRYPLTMTHPNYRPSQMREVQNGLIKDTFGTPDFLPPVTAITETDEEYYKAQGYEPAGKVDPSAWARAHSSAVPATYTPQKYPMVKDGRVIESAADDPDATPEDLEALKPTVILAEPDARVAALEAQVKELMDQLKAQNAPKPHAYKNRGRPRKIAADL
jgi:ABC-type Fe3+-hydroxamate transport system substrate-binding protein